MLAHTQRALAFRRWQILPPTPAPVAGTAGYADVNGIRLYYVRSGPRTGVGVPVLMLHGGLANSDYFGHQIPALARQYDVIAVDSRGHGRSTRNARPFSYDLMTEDMVGLIDQLDIPRVRIVGWSDGGIIGLDMAMRHPDRVERVFAFGANTRTSGLRGDVGQNPTFGRFIARTRTEYARLSPTPQDYEAFVSQISKMWRHQPNWTDDQLRAIRAPVLIAAGQYDEAIRRDHTEYMAATIPGAGLLILPKVGHFAFLQDPTLFNAAVFDFIKD